MKTMSSIVSAMLAMVVSAAFAGSGNDNNLDR